MNTFTRKNICILMGCILLALGLFIILLVSCDGGNVPNEKAIREDVATRLTEEYKQPVMVKGMSINKGLPNDMVYIVTVTATVEYADAAWNGLYELVYTKYEQGWMLDSLNVKQEELKEVISIPTVEELYEMVYDGNEDATNGIVSHVDGKNELEFQWDSISRVKHAKVTNTYKQTIVYDQKLKQWKNKSYKEMVRNSFDELTLDTTQTKIYDNEYVMSENGIMKIHEINNDTVLLDWGSYTTIEHTNVKFTRARNRDEVVLEKFNFDDAFWYVGENGHYLAVSFEDECTRISIKANPYYMIGGHTRAAVVWE